MLALLRSFRAALGKLGFGVRRPRAAAGGASGRAAIEGRTGPGGSCRPQRRGAAARRSGAGVAFGLARASGLRWPALVAVVAVGAVSSAADAPEAALPRPGAILVVEVTGDVQATFGDQRRAVQVDERLRVDAVVTTGRRATVKLQLSNGAMVQLGSESEIEFEEFGQAALYGTVKLAELKEEPSISRTRIRLIRGEVGADVKPLKVARGSSFTCDVVAGTLRIAEGSFRAMVRMTDLGLGVCTVELLNGKADFEIVGAKPEPLRPGAKLGFAVEVDKVTGNVKLGDLPKPPAAK